MVLAVSTLTRVNPEQRGTLQSDEFNNESVSVGSDTFVDVILIDYSNYTHGTFQIFNADGSNSLTYKIYGHVKYNAQAPFDFDTTWEELTRSIQANGIVVTAQNTDTQTLTDRYAWILIRMKRTTAGNNATARVYCRFNKD